MILRPIKTERDYDDALKRLERIFDAPGETDAGNEAEILTLLIEDFEDDRFPIAPPDPIEAIKIRMEEMNLRQKDMVGILGGKSRVSEVLNRKKRLTVEMIRKLEVKLGISASILVNDYKLVP